MTDGNMQPEKSPASDNDKKGMIASFLSAAASFFRMLRDIISFRYRKIPWWTLFSAVFVLLYLVNPLDLFPDALPLLGQIDDAAVLVICLRLIGKDIAKYEKWKTANNLRGSGV